MRKKEIKILTSLFFILWVVIAFFIIWLGYVHIHEFTHEVVCESYDLVPEVNFDETNCDGIEALSDWKQMLFYIAPYILNILLMILLLFLAVRWKILIILMFIPTLDTALNMLPGYIHDFIINPFHPEIILILVCVLTLVIFSLIFKLNKLH